MSEPEPIYKASPDGHAKKRKRKTYSCIDCRRRKLKCDREQPCGRCQKEGHPQTCVFNPESAADWHASENDEPETMFKHYPGDSDRRASIPRLETAARNGILGDASADTVLALRRKVDYLEARIAALESHYKVPGVADSADKHGQLQTRDDNDDDGETGHYFKGKGFKTFCFGTTNVVTMITLVCSTV